MTTALYVPGTSETDQKKLIMSQQLVAGQTSTNTDNITTNTANIASNTTAITALQALVPLSKATNSLGADVALNNVSNFFDGPSMAQGTSGTWFASGQVTCLDTAGSASIVAKLWDGTTVIDSALGTTGAANARVVISLSGYITSPAANIRISVQDGTSTSGKIIFNASGLSKDSTISGIRIG